MLENLRFADGRSLKECLEEVRLKRRLKEVDGESDEDSDTVSRDGDESPADSPDEAAPSGGADEVEDGADSASSSSRTEEIEPEAGEGAKNRQTFDESLEMLVSAEADVNRRKSEFAKGLTGMDEADKDALLKDLGAKLGDLNKEMESAKQLQDDQLKARLAARERKRKASG